MSKDTAVKIPDEYYDYDDSENICFLCGNPIYSLRQKITHFGVRVIFQQCQCGITKQTPMPNEKFFSWFFNSDIFYKSKKKSEHIWGFYDYFRDESSRLATSRLRYKKLKRSLNLGDNLSIMKIGPSTGTFLYIAKENGHNVLGCDISDEFSKYAKSNYDVDIEIGRFERMGYGENRFDMILLFNVIENIPNLDEFLRAVYRTIKPCGYFIFNHVPMDGNLVEKIQGGKYFMYRPPICYMFTKTSLSLLMKNYDFQSYKTLLDIRFMTPEKILSLLGYNRALKLLQKLNIHRFNIPLWAYPSRISVFRVVK